MQPWNKRSIFFILKYILFSFETYVYVIFHSFSAGDGDDDVKKIDSTEYKKDYGPTICSNYNTMPHN